MIGPFAGNLAAIVVAWRASPYAFRLRPDRAAARRYLRLLVAGVRDAEPGRVAGGPGPARGVRAAGRARRGRLHLAGSDPDPATPTAPTRSCATTIYPAIVRVRERGEVLGELFEKANRLTLMWAFPFGAGLALFGADLIVFVLGDDWRGAIVLLGGLAVAVALQQVGYSWFAFYRARGESWPQAVESVAFGASFAALAVPGALIWGDRGAS